MHMRQDGYYDGVMTKDLVMCVGLVCVCVYALVRVFW